eukprot:g57216.t1
MNWVGGTRQVAIATTKTTEAKQRAFFKNREQKGHHKTEDARHTSLDILSLKDRLDGNGRRARLKSSSSRQYRRHRGKESRGNQEQHRSERHRNRQEKRSNAWIQEIGPSSQREETAPSIARTTGDVSQYQDSGSLQDLPDADSLEMPWEKEDLTSPPIPSILSQQRTYGQAVGWGLAQETISGSSMLSDRLTSVYSPAPGTFRAGPLAQSPQQDLLHIKDKELAINTLRTNAHQTILPSSPAMCSAANEHTPLVLSRSSNRAQNPRPHAYLSIDADQRRSRVDESPYLPNHADLSSQPFDRQAQLLPLQSRHAYQHQEERPQQQHQAVSPRSRHVIAQRKLEEEGGLEQEQEGLEQEQEGLEHEQEGLEQQREMTPQTQHVWWRHAEANLQTPTSRQTSTLPQDTTGILKIQEQLEEQSKRIDYLCSVIDSLRTPTKDSSSAQNVNITIHATHPVQVESDQSKNNVHVRPILTGFQDSEYPVSPKASRFSYDRSEPLDRDCSSALSVFHDTSGRNLSSPSLSRPSSIGGTNLYDGRHCINAFTQLQDQFPLSWPCPIQDLRRIEYPSSLQQNPIQIVGQRESPSSLQQSPIASGSSRLKSTEALLKQIGLTAHTEQIVSTGGILGTRKQSPCQIEVMDSP